MNSYLDIKTLKTLRRINKHTPEITNEPFEKNEYTINNEIIKLTSYRWKESNLEFLIPENYNDKYLDADNDFTDLSKHFKDTLDLSFTYEYLKTKLQFINMQTQDIEPKHLLETYINDISTNPMNQLLDSYVTSNPLEIPIRTYRTISHDENTFNFIFSTKTNNTNIAGKFICPNRFSEEWKPSFEYIISSIKEVD